MRPVLAAPAALAGLLLVFLSSLAPASAVILGIDYGQEYIKAALVKPGIPLEIVLTKDTKRKEVAAIGFKPSGSGAKEGVEFAYPERLYGADAVNLAARFPNDVYRGLKQIVGQNVMDDSITTFSRRSPALSIVPSLFRSTVAFQSSSAPSPGHVSGGFTVEELVAMQLRAIVRNAEAMAGVGTKIKDVVFTVPAFMRGEERASLRFAAELVGLRVMSFVSDGLAVGINYATTRTFDEQKPEYHIVYDMGAGSTTATVLRFQGKSVKDVGRFNKTVQEVTVLGIGYDADLGGDLFNQKVFEILLDDFVNSNKAKKLLEEDPDLRQTVWGNGRAAAKLWKEATRVRQILSANADTIGSVESLFNEIDFRSSKVTRAAFEELITEYEARISKPIYDAISNAGVPLSEINTLIAHGGAVRTPFVGKKLEDVMGGPERISKQVNPDEAAVLGATFRGAAESGSFKVKDIRAQDICAFGVSISYKKDPEAIKETSQQIFPFYSKLGFEKILSFARAEDFSFSTLFNLPPRLNDPKQRPGKELLHTIRTSNLTESAQKLQESFGCEKKAIIAKFGITLDPKDAIPKVQRAWVECEVETVQEVPKKDTGGAFEDVKGFFGYGKKRDDEQQVLGEKEKGAKSSPSSTTTEDGQSLPASTTDSTETKAVESDTKVIKKVEKVPVSFTATKDGFPEVPEKDKKELISKIRRFDKYDETRRRLEEARNNLEAYTYRARGYLSDEEFIIVSTQEQREKLDTLLSETGDWLYGDGYTATLKEVQEKIKQLESLETPISRRKSERASRPEAIKSLQSVLENGEAFISRDESLAKISTESPGGEPLDTNAFKEALARIKAWAEKKIAEQEKLEPYEDPVVTTEEMSKKSQELTMALVETMTRQMELEQKWAKAQAKAQAEQEKREKEREEKEDEEMGEKAEEETVEGGEKEEKVEAKREKLHGEL